MKIALLTHHWVPNFGANLQALSTFSILTKKGHDTTVLNYIPEQLENRYKDICTVPSQSDTHMSFCAEYLNLSPVLRTEEDIISYCDQQGPFDLIICGSDAILRLTKNNDSHEGAFPNPYWLNWVQKLQHGNQTKTAFLSASCTGSNYLTFPRQMKNNIFNIVRNIDYISVRDPWTKWMLRHISKEYIAVKVNPDPVFAFNSGVSKETIKQHEVCLPYKKYILFSMHPNRVSQSWVSSFIEECHKQDIAVVGFPFPEFEMPFEGFDENLTLPLHPLSWYSLICNSYGFIGERFHPTVTSITNGINCVSVDHYRKRGLKKHFKWLNFPFTSKVYQVCKDANALDTCVHYPNLEKLSADKALQLLTSFNKKSSVDYQLKAQERFLETIDEIIEKAKR